MELSGGLERARPSAAEQHRSGRLWSIALVLVASCNGEHLVVGGEVSGGVDAMGADGDPMPASSDEQAPTPIIVDACPADPAQRRQREGCWPSRYVGLWRGFFVGEPQYEARDGTLVHFPEAELELAVDSEGSGSLTFVGAPAPAPPTGAEDPYLCSGRSPSSGCDAAQQLVEGFVYGLEEIEIFDAGFEVSRITGEDPVPIGERFDFGISLGEPWRSWCGLQMPVARDCACGECQAKTCFEPGLASDSTADGTCEASVEDVACGWLAARTATPCICTEMDCVAQERFLQVELRMSDDGRALRGWYRPPSGSLVPGHIEFSREQ